MPNKRISYAEAIREALDYCLEKDPNVVLIGEGVPDPKGIFGTTSELADKYSSDRVFDMPLSENAMTGMCIGAAINGMRPVLVHQRLDFSLLSMDQIINNAAKWHYMFDGKMSVPLVIRMIIGRGWGQGPQHSQSLQSLFAHIPGLKVLMPTFAMDAKLMMINAIEDNNPVIFIEHRWLHTIKVDRSDNSSVEEVNGAKIVRKGVNITIAAFSYMVIEAVHASRVLQEYGIAVEVIDMRYVRPLDTEKVIYSVGKTGHLIVADTGVSMCGISAELVAAVCEENFSALKNAPVRITAPDHPIPTSRFLANECYPSAKDIVRSVLKMLTHTEDFDVIVEKHFQRNFPEDVPYHNYVGPF